MDFTAPGPVSTWLHQPKLAGRFLLLPIVVLCACAIASGCASSRPRTVARHAELPVTPKSDVADSSKQPMPPSEEVASAAEPSTVAPIPQGGTPEAKTEPKPAETAAKPAGPPPVVAVKPEKQAQAAPEVVPSTFVGEGPKTIAEIKKLVDQSVAFYQKVPSYTCRVTRQERLGRKLMPVEVMEMRFRREPRSVYYKWLNEENAGRECVYVENANNGNVITRGGKSDFLMVGKTVSLDPNGMLARSKSRYSITESGLDNMVGRLQAVVDSLVAGEDVGFALVDKGLARREESKKELRHIQQTISKGADPLFPEGGLRNWYFDPETSQLFLMEAFGPDAQLLEYYQFDRFFENELIEDSDFDPELLWSKEGESANKTAQRSSRLPK